MKFNLKKFLKNVKLNEENISMLLGGLVVVIVGILVVNYFKDKGSTNVPGSNTQNGSEKVHTVTKGETLWSISEDAFGSGYNWVDIKKSNNLKTDTIEVGQKLTIPDVASRQPTATKMVTKASTTETVSGEKYTVVKGDNLWKIAVKAYGDGYKWTQIAKANKLVNPNIIHPGNVLTLPR